MELTKKNYFTNDNKYISNSKIGDWLKDKNYFYRKNFLGTVEREVSDPMIIGSAVDTFVTGGEKKFKDEYIVVTRRSKKQPDYEHQLNNTMYNQVEKMSRNIMSQDAYKGLEGYTSQKILQIEKPIGIFPGMCGIPDWFKVDGDRAVIVDLKTAEDANPGKYFYKCRDYGYFRQMAFYYLLISHNYGVKFDNFRFRHLVVEKDKTGINNVFTFEFKPKRVEEALEELIITLDDIAVETEFAPHNASWDKAVII